MIHVAYAIIFVLIFILATSIGSFLNVLIYRIPRQLPFTKGRSVCPSCGMQIKAYDLIPVLSYIILRGKCRNCKSEISWRYLVVELLTGFLGLIIFITYDFSLKAFLAFFLTAILIVISMIDFDTMTIPNRLIAAIIPVAAAGVFVFDNIDILSRLIGFFCVSVPMLLLTLKIPDSFGGGDVKLIAVCGFILGWQNTLLAAFIAIMLGGIVAVYLLAAKQKGRGAHIAFGPYICVGVFIALLWGDKILNWYLKLGGIA